jgi:hypothetical protein
MDPITEETLIPLKPDILYYLAISGGSCRVLRYDTRGEWVLADDGDRPAGSEKYMDTQSEMLSEDGVHMVLKFIPEAGQTVAITLRERGRLN